MGIMENLGNLASQLASGAVSESDVHGAYDQASRSAPQGSLATALSHTFQSDQTPPFEQMIAGLFQNSSPDQKAGLLNKLSAALGSGGLASLGSAGSLGALSGPLAGGTVTPEQAQQVTPQQVQVLAQKAATKNPSIVDAAAGFYAQHPTLVKAIGAGALALLMSRLSASRR
ncbi:MAG: hypothetical protein ACM3NW_01180 [Syntrophomonadaceae bacterium]